MSAAATFPSLAGEPRAAFGFQRYTLRDLLIEVFYHRWIMLAAFAVPLALGVAAAAVSKPAFVAQARLLVLYGSEYIFRPVAGQPGSSVSLDRNQIIQGELQVLQSTALAMETLRTVGVERVYPGMDVHDERGLQEAAGRFSKDLSLSSIPQSNILELSFRNRDAAVSAAVLRALIAGYLQRRVAVFERPPSAGGQVDQAKLLDRLHGAETAFAAFNDAHGIGNFDEQMLLLLRMQSANAQARSDAAAEQQETAHRVILTPRFRASQAPASVRSGWRVSITADPTHCP